MIYLLFGAEPSGSRSNIGICLKRHEEMESILRLDDQARTMVSSVSAWCSVRCVLVDSVETMVITPFGGLSQPSELKVLQMMPLRGCLRRVHNSTYLQRQRTQQRMSGCGLTGNNVDHIAVILRRRDVWPLLLLHEGLEHPDRRAVHIAGDDADAYMLSLRVLLKLENQPVPLFLQVKNDSSAKR